MTRTIAISMFKDEADVAEGCVRHMAGEVDHVYVADNGSTDGTRDILDQLAEDLPVTVLDDPVVAYNQSEKMSELAAKFAEPGDVVIPFDADELWTVEGARIRDLLPGWPENVFRADLFNHLRTKLDDPDPDPFRSMVYRQRSPGALPKVAFRYEEGSVIHQGNHGVTLPSGPRHPAWPYDTVGLLTVRHFPIRSAEQMITKARNGAAAYKATDMDWDQGAHWRSWGQILDQSGPAGIHDVFQEHWLYRSPVDAGLIRDPAPYRRWEQ